MCCQSNTAGVGTFDLVLNLLISANYDGVVGTRWVALGIENGCDGVGATTRGIGGMTGGSMKSCCCPMPLPEKIVSVATLSA